MPRLPLGMRAAFTVYMVSDATELESVVTVSGATRIPEDPASLVDAAILASGKFAKIDDFRPMTNDEIEDYIEAQEEENDNE